MTNSLPWLRALLELTERPTGHSSPDAGSPPPVCLASLDPQTVGPDPDVIAAAVVYARRPSAQPGPQVEWARYAFTATRHLWGAHHPVAMRSATIYSHVLRRHRLTGEAVRVRAEQLALCGTYADPSRELAARCHLALALHDDGQCAIAEKKIRRALRQWWGSPHGFGHASTVLLGAAAIHAGCGRITRAVNLLTDDAAHLADLDASNRRLAATWLATVTRLHPTGCNLPRPGSPPNRTYSHPDQQAFWMRVLQPDHSRRPRSGAGVARGRAAT